MHDIAGKEGGLRRLGFELLDVSDRDAIDGNTPRLHGLGDFPDQLDFQQAVLERRASHLHVVG